MLPGVYLRQFQDLVVVGVYKQNATRVWGKLQYTSGSAILTVAGFEQLSPLEKLDGEKVLQWLWDECSWARSCSKINGGLEFESTLDSFEAGFASASDLRSARYTVVSATRAKDVMFVLRVRVHV